MFERLRYRISSAPGLLQRDMENILSRLERVVCFYDDVVIFGKNDKEVMDRLHRVLESFEAAWLTVKISKCKFLQDNVTFLGFCVNKDGLHIPEDRIRAMIQVKVPKYVYQLEAFLSLINYYSKFFLLYALMRNNVTFSWGKE